MKEMKKKKNEYESETVIQDATSGYTAKWKTRVVETDEAETICEDRCDDSTRSETAAAGGTYNANNMVVINVSEVAFVAVVIVVILMYPEWFEEILHAFAAFAA